jgi:hypothetical protein
MGIAFQTVDSFWHMRKWSQLSAAGSPKQVTEVELFLDKSRKSFFDAGQVEFTSPFKIQRCWSSSLSPLHCKWFTELALDFPGLPTRFDSVVPVCRNGLKGDSPCHYAPGLQASVLD